MKDHTLESTFRIQPKDNNHIKVKLCDSFSLPTFRKLHWKIRTRAFWDLYAVKMTGKEKHKTDGVKKKRTGCFKYVAVVLTSASVLILICMIGFFMKTLSSYHTSLQILQSRVDGLERNCAQIDYIEQLVERRLREEHQKVETSNKEKSFISYFSYICILILPF